MIRLEKRGAGPNNSMHVPHERETAWRRVDVFIPVWNIVLKLKLHVERFIML
jgi:hypothetical protein